MLLCSSVSSKIKLAKIANTTIKNMVVLSIFASFTSIFSLSPLSYAQNVIIGTSPARERDPIDKKQAMHQSYAAHLALKKSLSKQLSLIAEREKALQKASLQETQLQDQLHSLRTRQDALLRALDKTQTSLDLMDAQNQKLQKADEILYHQKILQALKASLLLPSASYLHDTVDMPLFWPPPPLNALPSHSFAGAPTSEETTLALSLLQAQAIFAQQKAARLEAAHHALVVKMQEIQQEKEMAEKEKNTATTEHTQNDLLLQKTQIAHQEAQLTLADAQKLLSEARRNAASLNEEITHLAYQEAATARDLSLKAQKIIRDNPTNEDAKHLKEQAAILRNGTGLGWGHGAHPVEGSLFTKWGQKTENGESATGLTYKAPPHASVYAPCNGHILYTGAFRSFGEMVILDCGHKERFVLSGFGKITAQTGQGVKWGEIIGTMPEEGGLLFLQLHHDKYLLDPTPYLVSSHQSASSAKTPSSSH